MRGLDFSPYRRSTVGFDRLFDFLENSSRAEQDNYPPFDIEKLSHAAISNPKDSPLEHALIREEQGLRPGGLGLMMTRSLVDELIYNEARNEVVFIKYLD